MLANDEIRDTSDELGTTLHTQEPRIRACSRSFMSNAGWAELNGAGASVRIQKPCTLIRILIRMKSPNSR